MCCTGTKSIVFLTNLPSCLSSISESEEQNRVAEIQGPSIENTGVSEQQGRAKAVAFLRTHTVTLATTFSNMIAKSFEQPKSYLH